MPTIPTRARAPRMSKADVDRTKERRVVFI
jgi:hypothetical protein